jgi:hypothetical protein
MYLLAVFLSQIFEEMKNMMMVDLSTLTDISIEEPVPLHMGPTYLV